MRFSPSYPYKAYVHLYTTIVQNKIKFKADWYTSLGKLGSKDLVLRPSMEFGFLGAYNNDRDNLAYGLKSPIMSITGNENLVLGLEMTVKAQIPEIKGIVAINGIN